MKEIIHQPTLETIEMVEETLENFSGRLTKYQLWQKLPRKMMYQTYILVLKYLESSGKLTLTGKKLIWTQPVFKNLFKPKPIKQVMKPTHEQEKIIETLNPDERAILPYLDLGTLNQIAEKSGMDETRILRALQYLGNKNILSLSSKETKIVELGQNGKIYSNKGLPERQLLNFLAKNKEVEIREASKLVNLDANEFKAAFGALKDKALILVVQGKIKLNAKPEEIIKESLEEKFLNSLPLELLSLKPEQKLAFQNLKSRKEIINLKDDKIVLIELKELGRQLTNLDLSKFKDMIENLTSDIIRDESWNKRKFRRYDLASSVPQIAGGKKHFVNQAKDYARKVWSELGFKEMTGTFTQTGFWNFDALFTAQDHPVREIHDTFYLPIKGKLPDKEIWGGVKKAHEQGIAGSKGWKYIWSEEEAKKVILRTHTTCLSAQTLASLRKLKNKTGKFFAVGKCFRNETVDWGHLFEFNQTEGIVIDKDANFRNLLGYLQEFFKKMGFEKIKFYPSYFPYTEPSVEIYGYNKAHNIWIEIGGAGIFRPEVVIPLLGEYLPVLAWGPGFDRAIMEYYDIKDLREMYKNDLEQLRKMKIWVK